MSLFTRTIAAIGGVALIAAAGGAGFLTVVNVGVRVPVWLILVLPVCVVFGVLLIKAGTRIVLWAVDR